MSGGLNAVPAMRSRLAFAALLVALIPASPLAAQVMPTRVVRGPGGGLALSDGEPISYLLEHSRILDLSEDQKMGLMEIRRRLRHQTGVFMQQLDSIRQLVGVSLGGPVRRDNSEALERFQGLAQPVIDSIRTYNDAARAEARILLDSAQVVRLDSLVISERNPTAVRRPPSGPPRR
jgi:hypothetical protein